MQYRKVQNSIDCFLKESQFFHRIIHEAHMGIGNCKRKLSRYPLLLYSASGRHLNQWRQEPEQSGKKERKGRDIVRVCSQCHHTAPV